MAKAVKRFLVVDYFDEWEQTLALLVGDGIPNGGVLVWRDQDAPFAASFVSRAAARAAIARTHHYTLAFGLKNMPEKKNCKIVPTLEHAS